MPHWILSPPVAFLVIFVFIIIFSRVLSRISFKAKRGEGDASKKAYACGEDVAEHRVQVDYGEFYPFAFFFTILHVVALMVATVPVKTFDSFFIAILYIAGAVAGLVVLFRR